MPKLLGCLCLLPFLWPTAAGADPPLGGGRPTDVWREVATLMEELEYDSAIELLGRVLEAPETSAADRLRALENQGVAHVGAGRDDEALAVFRRLRGMDPGHRLSDSTYSPKIREIFDGGAGPSTVRQMEVAITPSPSDSGVVVVALRFDPRIVAARAVEFRYRWSDDGEYGEAPARLVANGAEVRVPRIAGAPGVQRLRSYALALAPSGARVARAGTAEMPVVLEVRPPVPVPGADGSSSSPLVGRWYFWTGLGVLLAGGVVAAVVVATSGDDVRDGSLGSQQMR